MPGPVSESNATYRTPAARSGSVNGRPDAIASSRARERGSSAGIVFAPITTASLVITRRSR
ncbi:hypothetical protein GEV43_20700 [Actinomadura sp. J1-007]|nr:hypothetical protein [Actinomadura sp. J1-007]